MNFGVADRVIECFSGYAEPCSGSHRAFPYRSRSVPLKKQPAASHGDRRYSIVDFQPEDQMNKRYLGALMAVVSAVWLVPAQVAGQPSSPAVAPTWTAPRTPDGRPDLQGVWTNVVVTPLERPSALAGREALTVEEVAQLEERITQRQVDRAPRAGDPGTYNRFWVPPGKVSTQTSLIIDPPDGRIPPLTPEAQNKEAARARALATRTTGEADSWEDLDLNDRCILWKVGPPMLPGGYNNNFLILQIPGYVVIHVEMIHDTRIIPLDGRPHLGPRNRQWLGDMRGHWEGDTLVVETTNLATTEDGSASGNDPIRIRAARGSDPRNTLRVVERFTRIDANTISYQFTIEDLTRWTKPWTGEVPITKTEEPIFEYACHEGNYSIVNVLSGARTREKSAEGAATTDAR